MIDWYSAKLFAVSIGILLLCVMDAFLTLLLLPNGADEMNPVMATFVYRSAAVFTAVKMGLTGCGVLLMVFLSRYRFMRAVPVEFFMYAILASYISLIGYELWMLKGAANLPAF